MVDQHAGVRIERNDNDPTVATIVLTGRDGQGMDVALADLRPGQGSDANLLRAVAMMVEAVGGSIDALVGEAHLQEFG